MKRAAHPPSLSPRALAIAGCAAFAIAGALFLAIAWNLSGESALLAFDERVSQWMQAHHQPALIAVLLAVTHLHSTKAVLAWTVLFGLVLARLRERYWMLTLGLSVGGGMIFNLVLKAAYERVRPRFEPPLLVLDTYSFPSGHTAAAVAFYGVLAAFLVSRFFDFRRRAACVAVAIVMVVLVALSRVYLGAHYVSDVVAAVCSSTVWLVLCLAGGHAVVRGRIERKWFLLGALVLLALAAAMLLPLEEWSRAFQDAIAGMKLTAGLVVFCSVSVLASLLLVPVWLFAIAAGAVFGLGWGFVAAVLSALGSALAAFLIARYVLRRPFERAARRSASFDAMSAAVAKEGWKVVVLLRLSPIVPSSLKSYFLGLTRIDLPGYLVASIVAMLPATALNVYVGATGWDALREGGAFNWVLFAGGLAATLGLAHLFGRRARRRLASVT